MRFPFRGRVSSDHKLPPAPALTHRSPMVSDARSDSTEYRKAINPLDLLQRLDQAAIRSRNLDTRKMNPQVLPGSKALGAPTYPDSRTPRSGLATAQRLPTREEQKTPSLRSHRGTRALPQLIK